MSDDPMTLIERLRNPAWVHCVEGFGSYASPQLDIESTRAAMEEAADALERSSERIDAAKVEPVHGGIQARCYIDRSPTGLWFFYSDEWRGMMLCHRDLGTLLSEIPKVGRLLYESMRDWHSKTPYTGEAQLRQMKIYEDFFGDQPDSAAVSGSTEGDPASVSQ